MNQAFMVGRGGIAFALGFSIWEASTNCMDVTEIWVAAGTYYPDEGTAVTNDDRNASFVLQNGLALYGGFAGTETERSARDWETNVTVLSGDLQQNDSQQPIILNITTATGRAENAYTVVTGSNTDNTAVIDGFTVTAGQANGASTLINNSGGGFFIQSGSPTLTNLSISGNSAGGGGGMYNSSSSPTLTNTIIWDNREDGSTTTPGASIVNVLGSTPEITHCLIANSGGSGNWYADIGTDNGDNIDMDPLFISGIDPANAPTTAGDFRLQGCSPAIDAGDNIAVPGGVTTDLGGNVRIFNAGTVDMGAYEYQDIPVTAPTGSLAITNSTCTDCSLSGGSIAIGTVSIMGGTLEYSTDNGVNWSSALPEYDQGGPAQTILASALASGGCRSNSTQVGMTVPGECQTVVASCQNQAVSLGVDGNASLPASALNGASSGCSGLSFSVNNANTLNFDCSDIGINTVTLTVTDIIGQTSTCTATVTVSDPNTPVAQCNDISIQLSPNGMATIAPADIGAGSEVTCGVQTETFSKATFDCFDIGPNTVTYTVTGTNGESDQCTAVVTIIAGDALPAPYQSADIGQSNDGNAYAYRPCNGQFSITSAARNTTSGPEDGQGFISVELCGDFTMDARIDSVNGDSGYGGLMARETNDPGSWQVSLLSNLTSLLRWEQRQSTNGPKNTILIDPAFPKYLRLARTGNTIAGYSSNTGNQYQSVSSAQIGSSTCLQVGITAFSNDPFGETKAVFSEVAFDGTINDCPAAPLALNDSPISGGSYRSAVTITSAGAVAPSTVVEFTAGESITLLPGFIAPEGSTFTARIEECLPPSGNSLWGGATAKKGEVTNDNNTEIDYRMVSGQGPGRHQLEVYPNPFRNLTTVALNLPKEKRVSLQLFDLTGKLVSIVHQATVQTAGEHHFTVDGSRLAPGVYLRAVQIGEELEQRRLVLMR